MKPRTIYRHRYPVSINEERLRHGIWFRELLSSRELPINSPIRIIQILEQRGVLSVNFVRALRASNGNLEPHQQDDLVLPSVMKRAEKKVRYGYRESILIPKSLFGGLPPRLLTKFCRCGDEELADMFCRELNLPLTHNWKFIIQSLEATALLGDCPPLLVAILNFVVDVGQPGAVCREKSGDHDYRQWVNEYPIFALFGRKIVDLLKNRSSEQGHIFDSLKLPHTCVDDDKLLCRIAIFFANEYIPEAHSFRSKFRQTFNLPATQPEKAGSKAISSQRKILQTLPDALRLVRDAQIDVRMTSALRLGASVVWASGLVTPHDAFLEVYLAPVIHLPREMPLIDPVDILKCYALEGTPPTFEDLQTGKIPLKDAAFRAMRSILVHCWQRHCSLIFLTIADFLLDGEHPEIHIRWTKTGLVNQSLPVWGIMPEEEIMGLRSLIHYCLEELKLPEDTRITKLAGFGEFEQATSFVAQQLFCEAMGAIVPEFLQSTHLPRATGLSWAPIRALACYYPEVLNHPSLLHLKSHYWFRDADLKHFREMLASRSTDSVELFRRIACWTTSEQFISTYCRSTNLLLKLYCYLQDCRVLRADNSPLQVRSST